MKRFLIWWARRRIASTYAELGLRLAQPVVGKQFVSDQLENIDNLERRVVALSM